MALSWLHCRRLPSPPNLLLLPSPVKHSSSLFSTFLNSKLCLKVFNLLPLKWFSWKIFSSIIESTRRYDLGIFAWDSLTPAQRERRQNLIAQFRRSSPPPLFSNRTCNSVIFLDGRSGREKTFPSLWRRGFAGRWAIRWRIISLSTSFEFYLSFNFFCRKSRRTKRGREEAAPQNENLPHCQKENFTRL